MQQSERKPLLSLLDELCGAVEELLLAGLTTASKSTVERIDISFKEASRMRLLRLGSTLRIANEEIARFTTGSAPFSAKRLAFFLGRAWVLATGMRAAIAGSDDAALDRLMSTPQTQPVPNLKVVTLGVSKRIVPGAFAGFDFRLRVIEAAPPIAVGEAMIWSCVFPMRKDLDLPAEAFLHLPQKQKFKPSILLEKKVVRIARCAIHRPTVGAARVTLNEESEITVEEPFTDWKPLWGWNLREAAGRLNQHRPTPLDLEIELQEEVFLDPWQAGERKSSEEGYDLLPLSTDQLQFEARLDRGPSGMPLVARMEKLAAQKQKPPLYGIAHYEACKFVLQPLATLGEAGPDYLTVSAEKISAATIVKAMKFT